MRCEVGLLLLAWSLTSLAAHGQDPPFADRTFESQVFGQPRSYRLFLPGSYNRSDRRYPVIYYFHGHSDRYTLEHYDQGQDTVPKIARFVAGHEVIVVTVDGYVAEHYDGFYGGSPWDIRREGGQYDFGTYFRELVDHIDTNYRTLTKRSYRATSGLSMGGFMSLYLSARLPDLIGSASAFNPGPEFYVGDSGRRSLWRPKDHVPSHRHTRVRLVRASGDFISQYHEETHAAYARDPRVDYEYRRDEYHRHWATSIEETFAFHTQCFARADADRTPASDQPPEVWDHANAYNHFSVWGYDVDATGQDPGLVYLNDVTASGFWLTTRRWAPDGFAQSERQIRLTTAPRYRPGETYRLTDLALPTQTIAQRQLSADAQGRLHWETDGAGHHFCVAGRDVPDSAPLLLPISEGDRLRIWPGRPQPLPLRIYNPNATALSDVSVTLSSEYPTIEWLSHQVTIPRLDPGQIVDLADRVQLRATAGAGDFAPTRMLATITCAQRPTTQIPIDVLVIPEGLVAPHALEILDGRTVTLPVFRQKGNQGGGGSVPRQITEGQGNGNGRLEPGEAATIWVQLVQGCDPFDKGNWYRAKVYSDSPWVREVEDLQEDKQLEWTSAMERTNVIRLSPETPPDKMIELLLDNESWSFHFTPDVRFGSEPLYQAFQIHQHHLHRIAL